MNKIIGNPKTGSNQQSIPKYNSWSEFHEFYFAIYNGDTVMEQTVQSKKSFVSMKSLFDEYVRAESLIAQFYDTLTIAGVQALNIDTSEIKHCIEFTTNAEAIKVINDSTDRSSWADIDIFDIHCGALTNPKGLFIVGDTLYQFGWDFIKFMPYSSSTIINDLVNANATDVSKKITHIGLREKSASNGSQWSNVWGRSCTKTIRDFNTGIRITLNVDFIAHPHHLNNAKWQQFHFTSVIRKRRLWGAWYDLWPENPNHSVSAGFYINNLNSNLFDNYSFWPNIIQDDKYPITPTPFQSNKSVVHFILKPAVSSVSYIDSFNALTYSPHVIISSGTFKLDVIAIKNYTSYDIDCTCNK